MEIKFYGVRGSYPVPGNHTIRYGGNTTCITISKEIDGKIKRIIIDCGTGAIPLGKEIVGNFFQQKEALDMIMLFTHLHPDHTQGFPFFAPNYFPQCNLSIFGMKTLKKHIGMVLEQGMLPPTFPIEYKDLKSTRQHYELKDLSSLYIKSDMSFSVTQSSDAIFKIDVMQSFAPSHPQQGSLYYKITDLQENQSIACVWDLESHQGGDKRVINFFRGCQAMIHDTQYVTEEYNSDKMVVQGFGHSTYEMAIENAAQAGATKLICMHFNPTHSDEKLDGIQAALSALKEVKEGALPEIILAKEGLIVSI